ncbi:MAG TPA: hypothetical protein VEX13_09465 [Chloroflexia bacterium]|nr:hypothetical protein [Chloroflexia bacterium]
MALKPESLSLNVPRAGGAATNQVASVETESRPWHRAFVLAVCALISLMLLRPIFIPVVGGDHYLYLAEHFLRGELWVDDLPAGYPDFVNWQGHKYLPFGPLPGVLLMPFAPLMDLAGTRDLAWVGHLFTLANVFLFARVLRQIGLAGDRRRWALLLFFGGTVYYGVSVVAATWYFAHIVVTTFLLLAISETLGKKRPVLIGLFIALAGATRFTALFALPFVLWLMWRGNNSTSSPEDTPQPRKPPSLMVQYGLLLVGLVGPLALLLVYNYMRFGSFLDSGYSHAVLTNPVLAQALQQGMFGLVHVPKNLFMLLVQGPVPYPSAEAPVLQFPYMQPSPWGMGLFFTSPALLYMFRAKLKEPLVQAAWIAVVCIMVPIITYYGVGWVQFGYRYALDFMPFLLLIAARGLPDVLTPRIRLLILASVVVNIWGALFFSKWV